MEEGEAERMAESSPSSPLPLSLSSRPPCPSFSSSPPHLVQVLAVSQDRDGIPGFRISRDVKVRDKFSCISSLTPAACSQTWMSGSVHYRESSGGRGKGSREVGRGRSFLGRKGAVPMFERGGREGRLRYLLTFSTHRERADGKNLHYRRAALLLLNRSGKRR